ncbi:hypothetical protein ACHWQZ_G002193 [Mnemiopsis leidyi]
MDPTTTTTTSPTVTFLPGKRGALNAVVDGYRYTKNGSHKENVYYRCVEQKTCNARITLTGGSLSSSLPTHLHPSQEADLAVLQTKSDIKKKASSTDLSTKNIVSTSLGLLDFEGVARLGCQLSSLNRMSQRARRKANRTPPLPTSLEQISIPSSYLTNDHGENMMLWDSGYTVERRRSFMFGSIDSVNLMNQYDAVLAGLPRSNNFVEGWHNGFQTLVGGSNPTLWTFLTALKKEENITFAKKVKKMMGEGPEAKRRKWRLYDERLSSIVTDFEQYDPMDYLSCIGAILFDI